VNILLVGEESAGRQTLRALTDGDHRIVAVMALRLIETASSGSAAIPLTQQDLTKREYFGREIPHGGK
jgi:hypothetical protein